MGCLSASGIVVEYELPKLKMRVRFPPGASKPLLDKNALEDYENWN